MKERGFLCFDSSPQAITYRAELHGTRDATVAELLQDMQEWIQDGATISVQFQLLTVDSTCDVSISSFTELECRTESTSRPETVLIIGVTLVVIVVLVVIVIAIVPIVVTLVRRYRYNAIKLQDLR